MLSHVARSRSIAWGRALVVVILSLSLASATAQSAELPPGKKAIDMKSVDKILKALDETTELEFVETPLTDVVDAFKQRHKIEIQLDTKALTSANVALDTPITRRMMAVTLRSALRMVLRDLDLAYVLEDEVLLITTKEVEATTLTTKIYPVRDLLPKSKQADGGAAEDYKSLVASIRCANAELWQGGAPPGQIEPVPSAAAIVVTHTEKTHETTAKLLAGLRKAQEQFKEIVPVKAKP
jgi:hypothetical protein